MYSIYIYCYLCCFLMASCINGSLGMHLCMYVCTYVCMHVRMHCENKMEKPWNEKTLGIICKEKLCTRIVSGHGVLELQCNYLHVWTIMGFNFQYDHRSVIVNDNAHKWASTITFTVLVDVEGNSCPNSGFPMKRVLVGSTTRYSLRKMNWSLLTDSVIVSYRGVI